jgi:heme/copper-type cytochrome/quinol oxidase subunit 4
MEAQIKNCESRLIGVIVGVILTIIANLIAIFG